MEERDIYSAMGEDGFVRLVAAFYRRIPADDVLGPLYPQNDLAGAEKRLRDFLIYRFGGPELYIEERGHPRLRMRHAPFPIGDAARKRWLEIMSEAIREVPVPAEVEPILWAYFENTAAAMMNRT
jgi:hemoglobin